MDESLMERRRVEDDGLRIVNSCRRRARQRKLLEIMRRGRDGKLCASSRGNTEVPSVVRIHWA